MKLKCRVLRIEIICIFLMGKVNLICIVQRMWEILRILWHFVWAWSRKIIFLETPGFLISLGMRKFQLMCGGEEKYEEKRGKWQESICNHETGRGNTILFWTHLLSSLWFFYGSHLSLTKFSAPSPALYLNQQISRVTIPHNNWLKLFNDWKILR